MLHLFIQTIIKFPRWLTHLWANPCSCLVLLKRKSHTVLVYFVCEIMQKAMMKLGLLCIFVFQLQRNTSVSPDFAGISVLHKGYFWPHSLSVPYCAAASFIASIWPHLFCPRETYKPNNESFDNLALYKTIKAPTIIPVLFPFFFVKDEKWNPYS